MLLQPFAFLCSLFSIVSAHLGEEECDLIKIFQHTDPLEHTEKHVLVRHACCILFHLRWNGHSLLLKLVSVELKIFHAAPSFIALVTSFCLEELQLCASGSSATHFLRTTSWPWGVARFLGLYGFPPCPYPSEGSGNNKFFFSNWKIS